MASIEKRGVNSYRLVVSGGFDHLGKRIKHYKTLKRDPSEGKYTKKELELELAKFMAEVNSGEYIEPEKTVFLKFVDEWNQRYAQEEYSPKTLLEYNRHIRTHIIPVFGHKQLKDIKTKHIVDFVDDLKKPGGRKDGKGDKLSSSTVLYIYKVLKSIIDRAFEWRMISVNPMEGVKQPTVERVKRKFYDESEASEVIKALYNEPIVWRLYFLGCILGGFRRGELLAIQWPDLDFENCTINVDKSLTMDRYTVGDPKNESSIGEVDMPEWYMLELKEYHRQWRMDKMRVGDAWEGGDNQFVFHSGFGMPYHPATPSHAWPKFLKRNGFRMLRLHDLRHTSGSLLFEAGEEMKSIQERLRHSRQQTTADIYVHVTKKKKKQTAKAFDKFDPKASVPKVSPIAKDD